MHAHAVHLPLGALLSPRTMCGDRFHAAYVAAAEVQGCLEAELASAAEVRY